MKKKEQYKHLLNYSANFILLLFETACFSYLWHFFYSTQMRIDFHVRGHWAIISLYLLLVFLFTHIFGGFQIGYLQMADICLAQILSICFADFVEYFIVVLACRKYVAVQPLLIMALVEILFACLWSSIVRRIYKKMYPPRQLLVIYGEHSPDEFIEKINSRKDKYNICASASYKVGYIQLYTMIKKYEAVVLCDLPAHARNQIMKYCYQESIRTYVTPKISDILLAAADDINLFDTPLLLMRNQGLSINQRFFKRLEDIVISILGIIITSPIMLLIALCVKLYDGGPIFYRQPRYTLNNRVFMILKFRSMKVQTDDNTEITKVGDDRITPVGRVIRLLHIDELPQLFNIFLGDMSVVGPRPEWKNVVDKYIEIVPEFALRTKVKAGLTGYAQVYGKYSTTPYDKVKLDIKYIENYSIWLDLKLILLTVRIFFKKEKSEGIKRGQKTAIREERK